MKFFIAHKVIGEDRKKLVKTMEIIFSGLKEAGHEYYCKILENETFQDKTEKEILTHAFEEIDNSDALFVFVNSGYKSEGMLMEVGYCLAKNKKIILVIKKKVTNKYLRDIADQVIEFEDIGDLKDKLGEIK